MAKLYGEIGVPLLENASFFDLQSETITESYRSADSTELDEEGFQNALSLFHEAALRVPAYKDFLNKNNITPENIQTKDDFKTLPIMDKTNYLRSYPLHELCWDGKLDDLSILSSSSGSTGEPFLWPRGDLQEQEGALNFEIIMKEIFGVHKEKTLYVISFAMGTWISGTFVLACAEYLARKGYPILSITPGIDMDTTFSLLKRLAPSFEHIVLSGYPPFVKDMIDLGSHYGFDWKAHDMRFLFAAEGFSETWRDYIHEKVGATDPFRTSINIYGSADAAILAHETPLAQAIRRLIAKNGVTLSAVFGDTRIPTLAQYDPRLKYFEEVDRSVIFTTRSGIPLIRYVIGDTGGVFQYEEMKQKLASLGVDFTTILPETHRQFDWHLPFVSVFGRSDLTVSLYGLLIYPEHIKYGLEHTKLQRELSGKFVMDIDHDKDENPYLHIRIELAAGVSPSDILCEKVAKAIYSGLTEINSEYKRLHESIKEKAYPVVALIENNNQVYFKRGTKQRWVKKQ